MKPPAVLYVLTKLELGGAQKVCLSLLEGVAAQGGVSALVSGKEGALVAEASRHKNVLLLQSLVREVGLLSLYSELVTFYRLIKHMRALQKVHPNLVVHTHSTKAGLLGRWAALLAGVRYRVHTVHGFSFNDFQSRLRWLVTYFCELITAPIITHFVCVSHQDQNTGSRLLPGFGRKSSIIRAAAGHHITPATRAPSGRVVFGSIACFKPQKNLLDMIRAFAQVCKQWGNGPLPMLEIIGDGASRGELEAAIAGYGLTRQVRLLGWQSNVTRYLHTWDVFVLSSLWEGLPCSIVEARMAHLPVVAYNVGGIAEVIFDGVNGYLIPPKDWQALAHKMLLVGRNTTQRAALGEHADNLHDFLESVMVKNHIQLYKTLVKPA